MAGFNDDRRRYCFALHIFWNTFQASRASQEERICTNAGKLPLLEVKRLKKIGTGGLKKIEHFYLSQPITLHPQNSIFFLSPHLSTVTENIYLLLSLCLVISIFSYSLVYPPTEVVFIFFYLFLSFSIFFSIFRDRSLVSFSILHLSPHSANFNHSQYFSVSILTTK